MIRFADWRPTRSRGPAGRQGLAWAGRMIVIAALTAGPVALMAGVSTAQAAPAHVHAAAGKRAVVVHQARRHGFGRVLVKAGSGRALYIHPSGACTGSCLEIWPRLVMPKGKSIPAGASCLGTKAFGHNHRRQVTYRGQRLYTFVRDAGHSVAGNGLAGFKVAKIKACR